MEKPTVAIVRYRQPLESVRKAVELSHGLDCVPSTAKVMIKPNIMTWTRTVDFPKWGAITTSRVMEDVIVLLKERGIDDITIAEGMVLPNIRDKVTQDHAFETLGYGVLARRYGIKYFSVWGRPFETVDVGDGITLGYNTDFLHSDFVVNLPVLKTHNFTAVSLGIKNLKGVIDIPSRKKCHSVDGEHDLNSMIAKLLKPMPPSFTLLDGIYTLERGPTWEGKARRSNILVGSSDLLAADMVGAAVLGFKPSQIPHLAYVASAKGRSPELTDVDVVGEKIEDVAAHHEYQFPYNGENTLPLPFEKMGIKGLSFPKVDTSMCTYCSLVTGPLMMSIAQAWKGEPWNEVEILTGKVMKPTPGKKKTILLGKCIYDKNKNHPDIEEMIAIKECPPQPKTIIKGFHRAGIDINPAILEHVPDYPGLAMKKYRGKPEFDESFFRIL